MSDTHVLSLACGQSSQLHTLAQEFQFFTVQSRCARCDTTLRHELRYNAIDTVASVLLHGGPRIERICVYANERCLCLQYPKLSVPAAYLRHYLSVEMPALMRFLSDAWRTALYDIEFYSG